MTVESMREYGLEHMADDEMRNFLSNQRMGVIGLPATDAPYLVPISFGYDGESSLYFTFVGGPDSRKRTLMDAAETVRFLTYSAQSVFNWQSLMLTGAVSRVPEAEWDRLADVLQGVWRPEVFEAAIAAEEVVVYRLDVDEWAGIKHTGLPPGFGVGGTGE
ncbi:pyridoxamine 5'-phosphate oxidase family protein [Haloarcula nitratireducens]|uniref:Pyridoxamine 5'-phosphate oxidase family protein n=1 Tax=Haloarcula nitratireducens TaxID=2487749 RepID=A0AAW4PCV2_9EURY|nr:pyridoxamine 5'-phosphate oxidase family protein [Halomicroarcula nitratireducens]MBX0295802.1 pyridoxamine 5'-phosphate oxidase family protein [Halomicroarcula nitratireducens]